MKCYENKPVYVEYRGHTYRGVVNTTGVDTVIITFGGLTRDVRLEHLERAFERQLLDMVQELDGRNALTANLADPRFEEAKGQDGEAAVAPGGDRHPAWGQAVENLSTTSCAGLTPKK